MNLLKNWKAIREAKAYLAKRGKSSLAPVPNSGGRMPAFDKFWSGSAGASVDRKAAYAAVKRENEARLKLFAAIKKEMS